MQKLKLLFVFLALLAMPAIALAQTCNLSQTLTDTPAFTANEIFEMQSTCPVEGSALGASFSGLGVDNEPHQQLANRTSFLNNHRQTDETNITTLQNFVALFTGSMGQNGYVKIPVADVSRGQMQYVVQWGFYSLMGQSASSIENTAYNVTFPVAFPNACVWGTSTMASNDFTPPGPFRAGMMSLELGGFTTSGMTVFTDWDNNAVIQMAGAAGTPVGLTGFYWVAVGF